MHRLLAPLLLLPSLVGAVAGAARAEDVVGPATAKSGVVVTVEGQDIRIYGIDVPPPGQKCRTRWQREYDCAAKSKEAMEFLVNGKQAQCKTKGVDPEKRPVGKCRVAGRDIAAVMVAYGWALAYRTLSPEYIGDESYAQSHRRGLWAGTVEAPWQWRANQQPTARAKPAAPARPAAAPS
jgi:endonuclease YncB( thermonuclease family)